MGLDEYDSESNSKLTLIPGHIYMFKYVTDTTTKYNDGRVKFEYYDTLPLVLCTGNNKNNDVNNVSQMEQIDGKSIDVINIYDLDGDRINDKVELLLDAKLNVVLIINNSSIKVFDVSNEQQIFGENLQDHFECQLRACGNTIVVGRTYTFTNKYGSTAAARCGHSTIT